MRAFKSKKSQAHWYEIAYGVIALLIIAVGIYLLITRTNVFGKSTGCQGSANQLTGFMGEGELFCYKGSSCPSGSTKASESGWAVFSNGCSLGQTCCVGKKPAELGSGTGVIEVRILGKETDKIMGQNSGDPLNLNADTKFVVWGTGDIKTCEVNLWKPDGAKVSVPDKKKDPTKCNPDHIQVPIQFGGVTGNYQLDVIGYNSEGKQIESTKIYLTVKGSTASGTESTQKEEVVFYLYNDEIYAESGQITYTTNKNELYYDFKCCENSVSEDCDLYSNDVLVDVGPAKGYHTLSEGDNIFELRYRCAGGNPKLKIYAVKYIPITDTDNNYAGGDQPQPTIG